MNVGTVVRNCHKCHKFSQGVTSCKGQNFSKIALWGLSLNVFVIGFNIMFFFVFSLSHLKIGLNGEKGVGYWPN